MAEENIAPIVPGVPDRYIELARKIAKLCQDAKLNSASGDLNPGYHDREWRRRISWSWDQGRHFEDSGQMKIHVTINDVIHLEVKSTSPAQAGKE